MAAVFDNAKAAAVHGTSAYTSAGDLASTASALPTLQDTSKCGECEVAIATWECEECGEIYCEDCKEMVHSKGRRKQHTKFVPLQICGQCQACVAAVECLDCEMVFCQACSMFIHEAGNGVQNGFAKHQINQLDDHKLHAVDLNVTNGFGIVVKDLTVDRFYDADHVESTALFADEIAAWCKEESKLFCDPEQATLSLPACPPDSLASTSVSVRVPPETMARIRAHEEQKAAYDKEKELELIPTFKGIRLWTRLSKILDRPHIFGEGNELLKARPTGYHTFSHDVHTLPKFERGVFQDTWLQLALSMVAMNAHTFTNLFVSTEYRDVGMYTFQFFQLPNAFGLGAGWQCVTIDDLVPCAPGSWHHMTGRLEYERAEEEWNPSSDHRTSTNGGLEPNSPSKSINALYPIFGLTDQRNETWSVLLEKAYAKFLGSYSHLHRGDTSTALKHFTGGACRTEHWDPNAIDNLAVSELWWRIKTGRALGLMLACVKADDADNIALKQEATGLVLRDDDHRLAWVDGDAMVCSAQLTVQQLHEMQVKHCRARDEGVSLIMLRNTQGYQEWDGDWSAASSLWKAAVRDYVNYKSMDEFAYWISIDDFVTRYNTVLLCSGFVGCPAALYTEIPPGPPEEVLLNAVQYYLTVDSLDDELPISFCLSQCDPTDRSQQSTFNATLEHLHEYDLRVFRVDRKELVKPEEVNRAAKRGEEDGDEEGWLLQQRNEALYEWPTDGSVALHTVEQPNDFLLRKSAALDPGQYVICVHLAEHHAKQRGKYFLSVHDDQDEEGVYSCPFPPTAKRRGGSKQVSNLRLGLTDIGSYAAPKVVLKKQRPKTPREELMERIEAAKQLR
eukprot:TRINITY_DN22423_c0_g1_i1.p1 TRINITY_DN22423_c0_g1~~TRINITY_DN22423_c0_g1_i1.p1  ORF type:complete len:846 (+),score=321.01 TRINITY_DN22423_c0_g1_i1:51-2588(+)